MGLNGQSKSIDSMLTFLFVARLLSCARSIRALFNKSACLDIEGWPERRLTIISCILLLRPIRLATCMYFKPEMTECCTLNFAFIRNVAPSLIVKGWFLKSLSAPSSFRSMMISGRPSTYQLQVLDSLLLDQVGVVFGTSRPRDSMTTVLLSFGSPIGVPVPSPSDSFHLRRDSSWASIKGD